MHNATLIKLFWEENKNKAKSRRKHERLTSTDYTVVQYLIWGGNLKIQLMRHT